MKIKICCISSVDEAVMAQSAGADFLGLVGPMPSGPGIISNALIREITSTLQNIYTVLLTAEQSAEGIINHWNQVRTSHIQIVRSVDVEILQAIKKEIPDIPMLYVIHISDESSIMLAQEISEYTDYILLDSGKPNTTTPTLGGTGDTHDWAISARLVASVDVPVFLAGGLNASNVKEAIRQVKPYGVDLCSGVRVHNKLDPRTLTDFMQRARMPIV